MYTKKIEEIVPGKVGECISDSQKCKSFQGPKVGPGPWLIFYGWLCSPHFAALRHQNLGKNVWPPPPTKSWIRYCWYCCLDSGYGLFTLSDTENNTKTDAENDKNRFHCNMLCILSAETDNNTEICMLIIGLGIQNSVIICLGAV